jgi:hypothetical protein
LSRNERFGIGFQEGRDYTQTGIMGSMSWRVINGDLNDGWGGAFVDGMGLPQNIPQDIPQDIPLKFPNPFGSFVVDYLLV